MPSNDLAEAGVVLRNYDNWSPESRPWAICEAHGCHGWKFADRFSASLVYRGNVETYDDETSHEARWYGGFIPRPELLQLNCATCGDGGANGKQCVPPGKRPDCLPGCSTPDKRQPWCDGSQVDEGGFAILDDQSAQQRPRCVWSPHNVRDMIRQQQHSRCNTEYNELIFDALSWETNLPHTIMAVWMFADGPRHSDLAKARGVHTAMLAEYHLSSDTLPLITFDRSDPFSPEPFALVQ